MALRQNLCGLLADRFIGLGGDRRRIAFGVQRFQRIHLHDFLAHHIAADMDRARERADAMRNGAGNCGFTTARQPADGNEDRGRRVQIVKRFLQIVTGVGQHLLRA